jgi:hypothetical protein
MIVASWAKVRANSRTAGPRREARSVEAKVKAKCEVQAKYIDQRMNRRELSFDLSDTLILLARPLDGLRPSP